MKKINGKISISRWDSTGNPPSGVTIRISDSTSWCGITEITMTVEDFANCLFGNSDVNCQAIVYDSYSKLGKFPIYKTILVEFDSISFKYGSDRTRSLDEFAKETIKPLKIDGWLYRSHNIGNSHYRTLKDGKYYYPIVMVKFVDTEEEATEWEKIADSCIEVLKDADLSL